MTDPDFEEYECPSCHGLVDLQWKACPHCGIEFDWSEPEAPEIIGTKPAPAPAPPPAAVISDMPSQPVVPGTRAPITIATVPSVEDELSITKTNGHPAALSIVEASVPNMVPTVLPSPQHLPHSEELADLERMITEAVAKAVKANMPKPTPQPTQVPVTAPAVAPPMSTPSPQRGRLGAAGLGLLVGGAVGLIVGMNWDVWIRGDTASFVGTIQQYGIIATAIATGAGAAVFILERGRNRRRPVRAG